MNKKKLQKILESHGLWLSGDGGECADLRNADLSYTDLGYADLRNASLEGADLSYASFGNADLRGADLNGADLRGADLSYADLSGADLRGAKLYEADLCRANLHEADLNGADLSGANLRDADLRGADLSDAKYNETTAFLAFQCPEEGAFVAWKKCNDDVLVKLLIPGDAKRSSATSRKCRASKAIVLDVIGAEKAISTNDASFVYEVGKEVIPDSFDDDRWNECSHGIHFFITRAEAERY